MQYVTIQADQTILNLKASNAQIPKFKKSSTLNQTTFRNLHTRKHWSQVRTKWTAGPGRMLTLVVQCLAHGWRPRSWLGAQKGQQTPLIRRSNYTGDACLGIKQAGCEAACTVYERVAQKLHSSIRLHDIVLTYKVLNSLSIFSFTPFIPPTAWRSE